MRLHFEMTGGYSGVFAARPLVSDVAVDELPEAEGRAVRELVRSTGLLDGGAAIGPRGPRPDTLTYRLTITDGGRSQSFAFDDVTAPPSVRPLLEYLQKRAIAERGGARRTGPSPSP